MLKREKNIADVVGVDRGAIAFINSNSNDDMLLIRDDRPYEELIDK